MKIIKERTRKKVVTYYREFEYIDQPGAGYSFECDENGVLWDARHSDTLRKCIEMKDLQDLGIKKYTHTYTEPAIGICDVCGEEVILDGFTSTCDNCLTDYNLFGQRLAPRYRWSKEMF